MRKPYNKSMLVSVVSIYESYEDARRKDFQHSNRDDEWILLYPQITTLP
jgi:hypothetical protein